MKIKNQILMVVIIFIVSMMSVNAITLSDQGTDVKYTSTGYLLSSGNLTVSIWDAISGGTNLFNYTFEDAIVNGSWNVMLGESPSPTLTLYYNEVYYKDYSINGEDVDFIDGDGATVERQVFQSPLGSVNSTHLINMGAYNNSDITADVYYNNYSLYELNNLAFFGGQNITWNDQYYTLNVPTGLGNTYQVGQELTLMRKNVAGQVIYAGQLVYESGSQGEMVTVDLADASNSSKIHGIGMVTIPSCNDNAVCPITYFGDINDLDTSAYSEGTTLYVSDDGSGNVTDTTPNEDSYHIKIGLVTRSHASSGIISFNPHIDYGDEPVFNNFRVLNNISTSYITSDDWSNVSITSSQISDYVAGDNFSNRVTVAKSGGDYTTVQGAIDSITDANSTNTYVVEIYPGVYEEQVTLKDYVNLKGMGAWSRETIIEYDLGSVIIFNESGRSDIINVEIKSTPTSDLGECMIDSQTGSHLFIDVLWLYSPINTKGCVLNMSTGSSINLNTGSVVYAQSGTTASQETHNVYIISGNSTFFVRNINTQVNLADEDDNVVLFKENENTYNDVFFQNGGIYVYPSHANYSGTVTIIDASGLLKDLGQKQVSGNLINIETDSSLGTFYMYILNGTNTSIYSNGNQLRTSGFSSVYFGKLSNTTILTSHFDDIVARDGVIGNGTYNYVNSPSPGDIQISGSYLNMYDNALMVAPRGGDYNTIQDAIDSITDASAINPYAILIYPGTYTEQITMKSNVNLVGMGAWARQVKITNSAHPVVNWTTTGRSEMKNIMIDSVITSDQTECTLIADGGEKSMFDMVLSTTSVNANGCMLEVGGVLPLIGSRVGMYYTQTGETTGKQTQNVIKYTGVSYTIFSIIINNVIVQSHDDDFVWMYESPGILNQWAYITMQNTATFYNTTYNGTARFFKDDSAGALPGYKKQMSGSVFRMTGLGSPASTGIGYEATNTMESSNNEMGIVGFGNSYFASISNTSTLNSYFDRITATSGVLNAGSGTYNYVNSPTPGDFQISGAFLNQYEQVITVESRGGDYNNIQEAIDSITDASETKTYTVKVMPGTYVENITLKDWVDLEGSGGWQTVIEGTITWNSSENTADGWSNLMTIAVEYTVSDGETHIIEAEDGIHDIFNCYFYTEGDGNSWEVFHSTNGTTTFYNTEFEYVQTGDSSSSYEHKLIVANGQSDVSFYYGEMKMNIEDTVKKINAVEVSSAQASVTFQASEVVITLQNESNNETVFFDLDSSGTENNLIGNNILMIGVGGNAIAYEISNSGGEVHSTSNRIKIEGFDTSYSDEVVSGGHLYSTFDNIDVANGSNSNPADYDFVSSLIDGSITVTGNIDVGVGLNQEMTLLRMKTGQAVEPVFRYDNDWFGYSALIWDYEGSESTYGVEATSDSAQIILRSTGEGANDTDQLMNYWATETDSSIGWQVGRYGGDGGVYDFRPQGSSLLKALRLDPTDSSITLNQGASVNDTDTVIDENSSNSQLVTALAVKNYVDSASVNGSSSTFDGWDKNESDDFDGNFTSLTSVPEYVTNSKFSLSTGLISGGVISINTTNRTYIDVTAGTSLYVDHSNTSNVVVEVLTFPATTIASGILTSYPVRWVGVERVSKGVGQIVVQNSFTQLEKRTETVLGRIWGAGGVNVTGFGQYSTTAYGKSKVLEDLIDVLGALNKEGNVYYTNPSLKLSKTAGSSFRFASLYASSPTSTSFSTDIEQLNISLYLYGQQNATSTLEYKGTIQTSKWDNAGVLEDIPAGNFTIQRIHYFPGSQATLIGYGQALYNSLEEAVAGVSTEEYVVNNNFIEGSILRGWIASKVNTTDLSNTSNAQIVIASGTTGSSSSGGGAESDPVFTASASSGITSGLISNWNLAYGWGDHSLEGYLKIGNLSGYDTNVSDDFNGSWTALTDIPAGFDDDVDDTNDLVNGTELDGVFSSNGVLERTGTATYSVLTKTGTGSVVLNNTPTITTPLIYLSLSGSIANSVLSYNATNDWLIVGDGANADTFVPVNTKTDEYLCSYESTGTTLECDTATIGTGNVLKETSSASAVTFNNVTISNGECINGASGGFICFNSTHTWIG